MVLDPFAGSGTTLIAAYNLGRLGLGVELYSHFAEIFTGRLQREGRAREGLEPIPPRLYRGDVRKHLPALEQETVDFILTSPPYWNILLARRSADGKQPRSYGEDADDLGLVQSYEAYLQQLEEIFAAAAQVLKAGGYCLIVVMDLRKKDRFYPLHIDLVERISRRGLTLDDIIVWDRRHEYNYLRPLGYPAVFRVNKVHEYLLIFKKPLARG